MSVHWHWHCHGKQCTYSLRSPNTTSSCYDSGLSAVSHSDNRARQITLRRPGLVGFANAGERNRLDGFLRRAGKLGYYTNDCSCRLRTGWRTIISCIEIQPNSPDFQTSSSRVSSEFRVTRIPTRRIFCDKIHRLICSAILADIVNSIKCRSNSNPNPNPIPNCNPNPPWVISSSKRKPSCRWQTRATLAKSLHGLRRSSGVVSCIARLPIDSVPMVSYYVLYSNCVSKMRCFGDTRLLKLPWPWNPGQGSLKVIESDTIR